LNLGMPPILRLVATIAAFLRMLLFARKTK